ncbi:MAG: DUF3142 domain-containing protein [Phycisphaerae bacterium]|jgi:hypothetical protein
MSGKTIRRWLFVSLGLAGATATLLIATYIQRLPAGPRASGTLAHEAYVWQRAWDAGVHRAVDCASSGVRALHVLGAEVAWTDGQAHVVRVPIDYETLRNCDAHIGLVLRIGPYNGPFAESDKTAHLLADLVADLRGRAADAGVCVEELQIDFDCATSKLDGYRTWLSALRPAAASLKLVITALPTWLTADAFRPLAETTDGFVLQVHSLNRPEHVNDPLTLCDPQEAAAAVERAGRIGVPFRVALPTYGYYVAFDANGRFVGLRAEGPAITWPAGTDVRTLRAEPASLATLVAAWNTDRPATMNGIIWYRLPTNDDELNWHWRTLQTVMTGRIPQPLLHPRSASSAPGLAELSLTNDGDADAPPPTTITARWTGTRLIAGDGLGGYELASTTADTAVFRRKSETAGRWIAPEEGRPIGWLRFEADTEVRIDVETK